MLKRLIIILLIVVLPAPLMASETLPKMAIVPGGGPKPDVLLALAEAKLIELANVVLLERSEIDKVLAEQKLSGMFSATNAVDGLDSTYHIFLTTPLTLSFTVSMLSSPSLSTTLTAMV